MRILTFETDIPGISAITPTLAPSSFFLNFSWELYIESSTYLSSC